MPKLLLMPKYWLLWLGFLIMRLGVMLPIKWQLAIGRGLGMLIYWLAVKRRHIAEININLCFPEKSSSARKTLIKDSFKNLGMGIMEGFIAWFISHRRFKKIPFYWEGEAQTIALTKNGQGLIVLGGHFTCLEIVARFFGQCLPVNAVYKKSHHPFFEYLVVKGRMPHAQSLIRHTNVKGMVRCLRNHKVLWYAPDQDFGLSRSVWTTFFGVPTATVTGVSVLAKTGHAAVQPGFFRRLPTGGYEIVTLAPLTNFPSGNDAKDAQQWQSLLEDFIRQYPEQYLWMHRRFKTRPEGATKVY